MLINIAFYGLIFVFSLVFQRVQDLSPLQTGLALAPIMIAITISNILAGRFNELLRAAADGRRRRPWGWRWRAPRCSGLGRRRATSRWSAQLTVLGAAAGSIIPVITSELLGSVDRTRSGVAAGTLNTLRQTGSAIGVALFGSLLAGHAGIVAGLHASLAITIGLCAVVVCLAPLMRGRAG